MCAAWLPNYPKSLHLQNRKLSPADPAHTEGAVSPVIYSQEFSALVTGERTPVPCSWSCNEILLPFLKETMCAVSCSLEGSCLPLGNSHQDIRRSELQSKLASF